MVAAIEQNFFQREIAEASFRYQTEVERGERVIVGVNRYVQAEDTPIETHRVDPAGRGAAGRASASRARPARFRPRRRTHRRAQRASAGDRNLMPVLIDAARDHVTMGEICDAWREVWGTWRELPVF